MIPVTLANEPPDFDAKVRQRGLSVIDELVGRPPRVKRPGRKREKLVSQEQDIPAGVFPPYWREALPDMLVAYERRCAYLAMYIHPATGNPTIDHVLPKSYAWDKVYEWSNYRLCAGIINTKKGELLTLVDPCAIGPGWFTLNLRTFYVERGEAAPEAERDRVDATLPVVNQRECVTLRTEYVLSYQDGPGKGGIDLRRLESHAPFIASELRRQGQLARGDV
ncbi:MAG: hypothetical protein FWD73_13890 [Polyangiaceae bacterium]|nr:hypothetical protein [Polyangiaceae bacterium]